MAQTALTDVDLAAIQLAQQIGACHDSVMAVFKFAANEASPDKQMSAMLAATRMMQANAAAASALKRLKSDGTRHTVTVAREGGDTPPQFSKTNNHTGADA